MLRSDLISTLSDALDWLTLQTATWSGAIALTKGWILDHFGTNGLIAALVVAGVLAVFIMSQLVRITLAALKYLVVPSIVLAFLASLLLPVSFATALPVTVTACSLLLLVKG